MRVIWSLGKQFSRRNSAWQKIQEPYTLNTNLFRSGEINIQTLNYEWQKIQWRNIHRSELLIYNSSVFVNWSVAVVIKWYKMSSLERLWSKESTPTHVNLAWSLCRHIWPCCAPSPIAAPDTLGGAAAHTPWSSIWIPVAQTELNVKWSLPEVRLLLIHLTLPFYIWWYMYECMYHSYLVSYILPYQGDVTDLPIGVHHIRK